MVFDRRRLEKLRSDIASARRSSKRAADLEALAKQLGRSKVKRGKEPTWESDEFVGLVPISIPHHGGKDIARGTKNSILDQLEDDLIAWEEYLDEQDDTSDNANDE